MPGPGRQTEDNHKAWLCGPSQATCSLALIEIAKHEKTSPTKYRHWLRTLSDLRVLVTPSQLKKFATGKGNVDKNVVIKEVYKRFGIDTDDDNTADAVVLGYIGLALTDEYVPTTQEQWDVIADIRKRHAVLVPAVAA